MGAVAGAVEAETVEEEAAEGALLVPGQHLGAGRPLERLSSLSGS